MADIQEEPEVQNRQQPNWGIILEDFRNITSQAALIPNVPAFDQGDRILLVLNQLSQDVAALQGGQATLRQEQDALRQGQDALQREHATIQQRLGALEQQLVVLDRRLAVLLGEVQELRDEISIQ